jgi:hypothetical protein
VPSGRSRNRAPRAVPDISCVGHPASPKRPDTLWVPEFRSRRSLHDEVDPHRWLPVRAPESPTLRLVERRSRDGTGRLVDHLAPMVVVAALVLFAVTVHW